MLDLFKQISFKYLSSYFQEHLFAYKKPTVLIVSSSNLPIKKEFASMSSIIFLNKLAFLLPECHFIGMSRTALVHHCSLVKIL